MSLRCNIAYKLQMCLVTKTCISFIAVTISICVSTICVSTIYCQLFYCRPHHTMVIVLYYGRVIVIEHLCYCSVSVCYCSVSVQEQNYMELCYYCRVHKSQTHHSVGLLQLLLWSRPTKTLPGSSQSVNIVEVIGLLSNNSIFTPITSMVNILLLESTLVTYDNYWYVFIVKYTNMVAVLLL